MSRGKLKSEAVLNEVCFDEQPAQEKLGCIELTIYIPQMQSTITRQIWTNPLARSQCIDDREQVCASKLKPMHF